MKHIQTVSAALLLWTSLAVAAPATELFSVRSSDFMLVRIDVASGAVTEIGTLAFFADAIPDATILDGKFYLLAKDDGSPPAIRLLRIDPVTAIVETDVALTYDGVTVPRAEGLTAAGGRLRVAFNTADASSSRYLSGVQADGTIDQPYVDYQGDMDALAATGGELYSIDAATGGPFVYHVDQASQSLQQLFAVPSIRHSDFDICGSQMYVVDPQNFMIHTVHLGTGAVLRSADVGEEFRGAALVDPTCGLFADGFESGDTSAWSSTTSP